jgi:hypothetical protein
MPTIQELIVQSNASIRRLQADVENEQRFAGLLRDIAPSLPSGLPYVSVTPHVSYARVGLRLEYAKFEQVRGAVELLPPVPTVKFKDSCTSLRPAEFKREGRDEKGNRTAIFGAWVELENLTAPTAYVQWYAKVSDILVRCQAEFKDVSAVAKWAGKKSVRGGEVLLKDRTLTHKLSATDRIRWWTPPDGHVRATLLWPPETNLDEFFAVRELETVISG